MSEINKKLANIQRDLKAPKGQFNGFGKYKYRSCEDILEAVKPLLAREGAVLTLSDHVQEMGGRVYIVACATLTDAESGDCVMVTAQAREEETKKGMDASQVTGAASSYARKYALNGLFCIDDTKDSDATNHGDEAQPKGPTCEDCGYEILPYDDGKRAITAEEMAERSYQMFGRHLCARCSKRAGKEAQG